MRHRLSIQMECEFEEENIPQLIRLSDLTNRQLREMQSYITNNIAAGRGLLYSMSASMQLNDALPPSEKPESRRSP